MADELELPLEKYWDDLRGRNNPQWPDPTVEIPLDSENLKESHIIFQEEPPSWLASGRFWNPTAGKYYSLGKTISNRQFKEALSEMPLVSEEDAHDLISIYNPRGELLVAIQLDGQLTYGEAYTPDEAAQTFWQAVAKNRPKED